ncbi:MAG TPA: hypothetical protein PKE64_30370, partial [Anaerolineae bacterium]|nr:hypothetical protein [Anaerolineae bacterium]
IVGGIIFLFLAISGGFAEKIKIPPERQKWSGFIGVILLFSAVVLHALPSVKLSTQVSESQVVFFSFDTFHLGDEEFQEWKPLHGPCFNADFDVRLPIRTLAMELETFGVESLDSIHLNGYKAAIISPQGVSKPNEWTQTRIVTIPTDKLIDGSNKLTICAEEVEVDPDFAGDRDDFQIRNIRVIVN